MAISADFKIMVEDASMHPPKLRIIVYKRWEDTDPWSIDDIIEFPYANLHSQAIELHDKISERSWIDTKVYVGNDWIENFELNEGFWSFIDTIMKSGERAILDSAKPNYNLK